MIPYQKIERRPTHPGEILREDFLPDYDLTATRLATQLNVSRQTVHQLLQEKRALSPKMALKLGHFFGNSPQYWMNLQDMVSLWDAEQDLKDEIEKITPLAVTR